MFRRWYAGTVHVCAEANGSVISRGVTMVSVYMGHICLNVSSRLVFWCLEGGTSETIGVVELEDLVVSLRRGKDGNV